MTMNTKKNVAMVLLVLSMLLWVMRKLNVLYVPGLSMILLAVSMIIVGIMMFQLKQKKKLAGTLIVAFGLFWRGFRLSRFFKNFPAAGSFRLDFCGEIMYHSSCCKGI